MRDLAIDNGTIGLIFGGMMLFGLAALWAQEWLKKRARGKKGKKGKRWY